MYIPKQWLLPIALSFAFAFVAIWLYAQNASLEAKVTALESADDEISVLRAELAASTSRQVIVPVAAESTPIATEASQTMASTADHEDPPTATQPIEVICVFPSQDGQGDGGDGQGQGTPTGGEGGGQGGGTNDGIEVSIENPKELGNFATNSGAILDSFFLDGGQGDIGINIYKSVLTGVNFSIGHQGGSNSSMTDSGNTSAEAVSDNSPTNTNSPTYNDDVELETPLSINGTIGPDTAVGVGDSTQGDSAPSSILNQDGDDDSDVASAVIALRRAAQASAAAQPANPGTDGPDTDGPDSDSAPPVPDVDPAPPADTGDAPATPDTDGTDSDSAPATPDVDPVPPADTDDAPATPGPGGGDGDAAAVEAAEPAAPPVDSEPGSDPEEGDEAAAAPSE